VEELRGKTALVTGASRGIGAHIARALAGEGMRLVLVARSAGALEGVAAELRARGTEVVTIPADLARRDQIEVLAERAGAELGGVDVLVNNAGLELAAAYHSVAPETIDELIAVNLTAPMILSRLLLPGMIARGRGHIVNISSLAGLVGTPYGEVYCATKHGLVGFTRGLRLTAEAEGYGVGASVICPGFISHEGMFADAAGGAGVVAPALLGTSPPEAVAKAVVRAILRDEPEMIVNGRPVLPMLLTQLFSPRLAPRIASRVGVVKLFRRLAEHRAATESAPR
jgi:short-subunit dehydrogenase